MHTMLLIAKREYLERVRTKAFLIATVLIPLLMAGGLGFAAYKAKGSRGASRVTIASQNTQLALDLQDELQSDKDTGMTVTVMRADDQNTMNHLMNAVDRKDIDGFLLLNTAKDEPEITYYSASGADLMTKGELSGALRRVLMRESLVRHGAAKAEVETLLKTPVVQTQVVKNGRASKSENGTQFAAMYVLFFLMYMAVMLHGMNVARSVIEEKTSRVFEVMLATVKPRDMMGGKLLGVGAVGLTQIGIWLAAAVALSATPLLTSVGSGLSVQISALQMVAFVVYFLLGFLFYSGIAAALGAMVNSEQELQQFNMLIALPMACNSFMLFPVATAPDGTFARIVSQIPFFSPLMMYVRISVKTPPWWEIALSIAILLVTIYGVIWVSSRIYRVGVLMYGKRPTLPELMKWLKYS